MVSLTTNDFSCDEQITEYFLAQDADGGDPMGSATLYFLCGEDQAVNVTRDVLGADAALKVGNEVERWALHDGR